jgi:hypothetical protein
VTEAPDTVTEALDVLRADGYTADFELIGGELRSDPARPACAVADAVLERRYRFEGNSDPGDEMVVFGLHDPITGVRGTLASAFGPAADPALADHLSELTARPLP